MVAKVGEAVKEGRTGRLGLIDVKYDIENV